MERRDLLRAGSAVAAAGIAGCAGFLGGGKTSDAGETTRTGTTATTGTSRTTARTTTSEPSIEVEIETPSTPRTGDTFEVVVRAKNAGGGTATFEDTLSAIDGTPESERVEVGPIPPGEVRTTRVSVRFDSPGRHRVLLVETNLKAWLQVAGTPLGTSAPLGDGAAFALESVQVLPATFVRGPGWGYRQDPVTDIVGAGADGSTRTVAILRGTATATDDEPTTFDPSKLAVATTRGTTATLLRDGTTPAGIDHGALRLPDGTPSLAGTRIDPGERVQGCLLCTLPYSAASEPLSIRAGPQEETPNAVWSVGSGQRRSVPAFAVRDLQVPEEMETARDRSFSVTVVNVGATDGRFRGILQDHIHHDVYTTVGTVAGEVAAGERTRLEGTMRLPWNYERRLQLRPSGTTATVQAGIARRAYGETYRMPNGVKVTALSPRYSDTIEFVDDRNSFSHGFWTVLVTAELPKGMKGTGKGSELLPGAGDFRCKRMDVDEANFPYSQDYRAEFGDIEKYAKENGNTIVDPVEGPLYPMDPPAEPSEGHVTGWMPIIIGPDERHWPVEKLEVQLVDNVFKEYDTFTAGWSGKF